MRWEVDEELIIIDKSGQHHLNALINLTKGISCASHYVTLGNTWYYSWSILTKKTNKQMNQIKPLNLTTGLNKKHLKWYLKDTISQKTKCGKLFRRNNPVSTKNEICIKKMRGGGLSKKKKKRKRNSVARRNIMLGENGRKRVRCIYVSLKYIHTKWHYIFPKMHLHLRVYIKHIRADTCWGGEDGSEEFDNRGKSI